MDWAKTKQQVRTPVIFITFGSGGRNKAKKMKPSKWKNALKDKFAVYLENTSIHGLKFIMKSQAVPLERLFWVIVCSLSIVGTYFLFDATLNSYQNSPVTFSTETNYVDWNTTFPAIFACEMASAEKMTAYMEYIKGSRNDYLLMNTLMALLNFEQCGSYCDGCVKQDSCKTDAENHQNLLVDYLAPCQDFLTKCNWNGHVIDCCEIFKPVMTMHGLCYAFNSMQTNESRTKEHLHSVNRISGPGILKLRVNERAILLLLANEEVPTTKGQSSWQKVDITHHIDCMLRFRVTEILNDKMLSDVAIERRQCRLPEENPHRMFPLYSYSTCLSNCIVQSQIKDCGCHHHNLISDDKSAKVCNMTGLACIDLYWSTYKLTHLPHANDQMRRPMHCDCLPSCSEAEYEHVQTTRQSNWNDYTTIELYMQSLPSERFIRNVVRTKLDLVVSLGGAAGLFLGASLLSIVELLYYCCIRGRKQMENDIKSAESIPMQFPDASQYVHKASDKFNSSINQIAHIDGGFYGKDFLYIQDIKQ